MLRVGMLTSGGDCQALNATMRAIVRSAVVESEEPIQFYGFLDGYRGLMYGNYKQLTWRDVSGLLIQGGTILGTSRTPFKQIHEPDEHGLNKIAAMKSTYAKLQLDCLCVLGGNGSLKTANLLNEEGLHVIGLPKTIDNDIWGTDMTFGFSSAIDVATRAIDDIKTTASSHGRVFVIEIMGHKVGWIPLYAGVAGGADVILIPEIPYELDKVAEAIERRDKRGGRFALVVVAEGALTKEEAELPKKEYKKLLQKRTAPSIAYDLAKHIEEATGRETRVAIPGHVQRGGAPDAQDRIFATQCGAVAGRAIAEGRWGFLVTQQKGKMIELPLKETAGKLKYVDPNCDLIRAARATGISFGDK